MMGSSSISLVFLLEEIPNEEKDTQQQHHATAEAGIEVMHLQTEEH